jgi:tetratricopeptide (TPR) repeat protein
MSSTDSLRSSIDRFRAWLASPDARRPGAVPRWVAPLALVALTFAAYWNSLWGEFVYDDIHTVLENPGIRGLAAFWNHLPYQLHRPLTFLSFAFSYRWSGLDPFGYHLANVVLHALDVLLVWTMVGRWLEHGLGLEPGRALERASWLAAAFFAVHPAQVESVSYVASRSSLLVTFFMLVAVLAHMREVDRRAAWRPVWRALGLASFVAAMATKEVALVTPLLLLAVERLLPWPDAPRGPWRESLRRIAPHVGLLAAASAVRVMLQHAVKTDDVTWSLVDHWRTEAGAWMRYPRLVVFPVNLNVDPAVPIADVWGWCEKLGLSVLVVALAAIPFLARRVPLVALAIAWFLINLAPTSLIPLQDFIAERRLYLALAGPAAVAGWALARLGERLEWSRRMSLATLAVVLLFATGTVARNRVWTSSLALWSDTVRKSPLKARPLGNLATALGKAGNVDAALADYDRALEINPDLHEYRIDRANLYRLLGRYDEALAELNRVVAAKPADDRLAVAAWHQIGEVYLTRGDLDRALDVFLANAARKTVHPETFLRIGRIYFLKGDLEKARQAFLESVHRWYWDPAGHRALAFVYLKTGLQKDAVRELQDALKVDPKDQDARAALAEVRAGHPIQLE